MAFSGLFAILGADVIYILASVISYGLVLRPIINQHKDQRAQTVFLANDKNALNSRALWRMMKWSFKQGMATREEKENRKDEFVCVLPVQSCSA